MEIPKISVCMIGKNEERTLPRCLKSLEQFKQRGGDMVFVDTGSTDNTAKIAEDFGMRTYREGNVFNIIISKEQADKINTMFVVEGEPPIIREGTEIFNYAEARNYATSLALNDYIISLDCDEILAVFDIDKVEKLFDDEQDYFFCKYAWARTSDLEVTSYRNIFNRKFCKWNGIIHEIVIGRGDVTLAVIIPNDALKIEHYPIRNQHRTKYLPALGLECLFNPNARNFDYLIKELTQAKHYKSAEMIKEGFLHELTPTK